MSMAKFSADEVAALQAGGNEVCKIVKMNVVMFSLTDIPIPYSFTVLLIYN